MEESTKEQEAKASAQILEMVSNSLDCLIFLWFAASILPKFNKDDLRVLMDTK